MELTRQQIMDLCSVSEDRKRFWKGKRCLVTGAVGMLGSWMAHTLVGCGANVTLIVRDEVPGSLLRNDDTLARVNIVRGSFTEYDLVERTMFDYEIEYVFHIGAQTQVRTGNREPRMTFESNIQGTWNVLEASRLNPKLKAVIIASSDKAYGSQKILPYEEDAPLQGEHPYDVSKSCADLLARCYRITYKLPVCVTRCGNLYGPGDKNFDRIIPGTIRSVVNGETPIIRSDGKFIRDYFFVPDAVDGYLTIVENMERQDIVGEAFNLSTGNRVTVLELFERIIQVMGVDVAPEILNQASNEIREQSLSSEKAKRLLEWQPKHTLDEGLRITVDWYRAYLGEDR